MPLSWNEIKTRATQFSKEWENETSEDAEAKTFWDEFLQVFGISRRRVATFETRVTKNKRQNGKIDLLWKGQLLVEHKSAGKDLDRAYQQAIDYFPGLEEHDLPGYIVVCNFQKFRIYNLDENSVHEFELKNLTDNIELFGFIAGYEKRSFKEEDPVNIEAAELMGKLHDQLKAIGYEGHPLEMYLVRLLFCLFAEDTGIFEKGIFQEYLELKTNRDGSDLAYHLSAIFQILNTPREKRLRNIDESLNAFPYVNGKLFEDVLPMASFDSAMRQTLMNCCALDWGKISPAIFGSMFQSVMNPEERRHLGAHYTSEKNILKVIKPLFLDELWEEFEKVKTNSKKLVAFHNRLSKLRFFDPACGCGNFLVITYRELRLLEIEILKILFRGEYGIIQHGVETYCKVNVDRFFGIEIEDFAAQIAQVAMWLMDHQMNQKISQEFGEYFVRLPLKKSATIIHDNALRTDWKSIVQVLPWEAKTDSGLFGYIYGNPPFIGYSLQNKQQKEDLKAVTSNTEGLGVLDYVTGWYFKAADYISNTKTKVAFVSTNSVSQGEQPGILWNHLFKKGMKIHFAHRTFKWSNEARGNAAVHVVIIGFAHFDVPKKFIFEYASITDEPHIKQVKNINPYLVEGKDDIILKRRKPISNVPEMVKGSQPTDGGNLLLTDEEKEEILKNEPELTNCIKPFISAREFLNNKKRWCFWLKNVDPSYIKNSSVLRERIENVKTFRLSSKKAATRKWGNFPSLFTENRQPKSNFILIPRHSSENRNYIPFGFFTPNDIIADSCSSIPNATPFHFGVLSSKMHMVWVNYTCGRLESRFRYSNTIVYNNFPWPENPTEKQKQRIEEAAENVLAARASFPGSSLADLYDPVLMPPKLVKAHQQLDKAVDLCYRPQPFTTGTNRMEFLFELYDKYTSPLIASNERREKKLKKVER